MLSFCIPQCCIDQCACAYPPNIPGDCGCLGCGLGGCLTGIIGWPPGLGYLVDLFKNRVQNYVERLISKRKPKKVLVCMIYYPDETAGGSWADTTLFLLGYNTNPRKLQSIIDVVFRLATAKISIPGTEVIPFPLFKVLDGKHSEYYCARVEPSAEGGQKMAEKFLDVILNDNFDITNI